MKNFKNKLYIEGSNEELKSLESELSNLGYNVKDCHYYSGEGLCTNFANIKSDVGYSRRNIIYQDTVVSASNKDLVLALAAMVDDNEPHVGEYVIAGDSPSLLIPTDKLFRICEVIPRGKWGTSFNVDGIECANRNGLTTLIYDRKATKEEIINYFMNKKSYYPSEEKKSISEDIIKSRLETLLLDKPELQDTLVELFPEAELDLKFSMDNETKIFKMNNGDEIRVGVRNHGPMAFKAIGLDKAFKWELIKDPVLDGLNGEEYMLLVPTRKK